MSIFINGCKSTHYSLKNRLLTRKNESIPEKNSQVKGERILTGVLKSNRQKINCPIQPYGKKASIGQLNRYSTITAKYPNIIIPSKQLPNQE